MLPRIWRAVQEIENPVKVNKKMIFNVKINARMCLIHIKFI
jgi:hypothetical protein